MKFKAGDKIIMKDGTSQYERVVVGYSQKGYVVYEYKSALENRWILTSGHEDQYKLAPVKKEGWINIYEANKNPEGFSRIWTNGIFDNKESAMKVGQTQRDYITTIHIEWEE